MKKIVLLIKVAIFSFALSNFRSRGENLDNTKDVKSLDYCTNDKELGKDAESNIKPAVRSLVLVKPKEKNYGLKPSVGVIPENSKVTTIKIQDIEPQTEGVQEKNMEKISSSFGFKKDPFVKFSNVEPKNNEYWRGPTGHPFFDAFFIAYSIHGEVALSPDDVWIQIASEISKYIDINAKTLRKKIVTFDKKELLEVLVNGEDPDFSSIYSKDFKWDLIIKEFSSLIREKTIGNIADAMEADFSTSKGVELVASQVALMNSCQKFFDYSIGITACGITKVHFFGELEDWQRIKEKINFFRAYAVDSFFSEWIDSLLIIIDEFIKSFQGNPDVNFWNSIVHKFQGYNHVSGGSMDEGYYELKTALNGWLLDFFLFNRENDYMKNSFDIYYIRSSAAPKQKKNNFLYSKEPLKDFEPIQAVPFKEIGKYCLSVPVLIKDYRTGNKTGFTFFLGSLPSF